MSRGLKITDFDAVFNMRRQFWEVSRDKALSQKEQRKPSAESEEGTESGCGPVLVEPARAAGGV